MKYTKESLYGLFVDLDATSCLTPMPDKAEELIDYVLKLQEENQKLKKLDLIKYLEDNIKMFKKLQQEAINMGYNENVGEFDLQLSSYQDILERVKNNNYD